MFAQDGGSVFADSVFGATLKSVSSMSNETHPLFEPVLFHALCHWGPEFVPCVCGLTLVITGSGLTQSLSTWP